MDDSLPVPPKAPLEPALRALAERQRRELGPHLDADELVAYHEHRLPEPEIERVRDHLALCPECAGLLLELDAFSEPSPAGAPDLTTGEVEASWRELAGRLNAARGAAARGGTVVKIPRPASPVRLPWALAAALLVGVIGLSVWTASLRRDLYETRRPRGETRRVLHAEGSERGVEEISFRSDRYVGAMLTIDSGPASVTYEAEIRERASQRSVWHVAELDADESGNVPLVLPAGSLAPGEYRIVLYREGGDPRHPTATYSLTLVPPPPSHQRP